jgi:hypothetical protein
MKTKAIVATLLVAAAASADARFAWPYPPKAVSPDESDHWIVINSNPWSHDVESELTTLADGTLAVLRRVRVAAATEKSSPSKEKMPHVAERSPWCRAQESRNRFHAL